MNLTTRTIASPASPAISADLRAFLLAQQTPYMVLDRELRYVEANPAYVRTVERSREEMLGKGVFQVFPNDGEGGRYLRASFQKVLDTRQPDSIALIPYAIARPAMLGGQLEMRFWSAVHTPILDDAGEVSLIIQNTVDVTELQRLKDMAYGGGAQGQETVLLQRAQEVQRANASLTRETRQLRDLFMQAPGFMAVLSGPDFTFTLVNRAYQQLIGHRPVIGKPLAEALPEVLAQGFAELLRTVQAQREPYVGRAVSVQLRRTPDGPLEERFLDFIYQPILDADGEAEAIFVEGADVTDQVRAERQQRLLMDELNHRVKNALATVQAIAVQTRRGHPEIDAFHEVFESRLMAFSATHDLLTASQWRGADLATVLRMELHPFEAARYTLDGPSVDLTASQALAVGLLSHELATNAAKYGALSNDRGQVEVSWRVEEAAPRLILDWIERDGPTVAAPRRRGFGSRLIERSLQGELGGGAHLAFEREGLRCRIELPLGVATEAG